MTIKENERAIDHIIKDEFVEEDVLKIINNKENILVVEGKTDREVIERIVYHLDLKLNFGIIEMKGVSNFPKLYNVFKNRWNLNIKYMTDNDRSAKRWIETNDINSGDVLTKNIYAIVKPEIKEIEEYVTNTPHFKHRPTKKKLLQRVWEWKHISITNVEHLIDVIDSAFGGRGFIKI